MKIWFLRTQQNVDHLIATISSTWEANAKAGHALCVELKREKAKRSHEQNARYWAMLNDISEQAEPDGRRYSRELWHEFFKQTFLALEDGPGGMKVLTTSTTNLGVSDFAEYMNKVEAYAAQELGVLFSEYR